MSGMSAHRELIVDSFAGGGGASVGIEIALGRSPDIAINHDAIAMAMHRANHPGTRHVPANIWKVDPDEVCNGNPIGLLWASPDCKHFSKAKGGKPVEKRIRDLAWVVVRWAKANKPRVIILENVEEFATWGPLTVGGQPCPVRKGRTFKRWVGELRRLGYKVAWRELVAADYGAPTTRKRLFLIARCDGRPIAWPAPTHGKPSDPDVVAGRKKPWRAAAEIIDWSLPCPSIFASAAEIKQTLGIRAIRPLADATMARIAKGIYRYVIDAAAPFIVPITHTGAGDVRVHDIREPLRTQTTAHRGEHALVAPFVTKFRNRATGHPMTEPLHTITAHSSAKHPGGNPPLGIVTPFLVPRYGERPTQEPRAQSAEDPLATVVPTGNGASLVAPLLVGVGSRAGQSPPRSAEMPLSTITATKRGDRAVVAAFLAQHNTDMTGLAPDEPVSTIVGKGCTQAVVSAGLVNLKGSDRRDAAPDKPAPTICAGGTHLAEVRAFLIKYYSAGGQHQDCREPPHTLTARDRIGLVTIQGEDYRIVDIGMRMLTLRERFDAQGFPHDYRLDIAIDGKPMTGEAGGRLVGNSVCPPIAAALVRANYAEQLVASIPEPDFRLEAAE